MLEFYENLIKARGRCSLESNKRKYAFGVYVQLMEKAFENEVQPDTLPHDFLLRHIFLEKEELEKLFEDLSIPAIIEQSNYSDSYGFYYKVTIK